jgi:hypothetical protein
MDAFRFTAQRGTCDRNFARVFVLLFSGDKIRPHGAKIVGADVAMKSENGIKVRPLREAKQGNEESMNDE